MPFDILINGGGIAGPSLAFWLTRQGHTVTIIEQARQLRTGGQAVDFRGPSLVVLEKMGLLAQVQAGATRMGPLVLVDDRGKEVGRLPAEVISGELEIHWGDLVRILYEAVRDDVNYRFGVRVTALDDDGQRVDVTRAVCRTVSEARDRHPENRTFVLGPARQATQRRSPTTAHPGRQQAGRQAVTRGRAILHLAELLNPYTAAAPWRPAPPAKRPAPSIASAATREMLANS